MSRFVLSSKGGRSGDEQRFLEKHEYILDQLDIEDAERNVRTGVTKGVSLYRSVPAVFKWLIFLGGAFSVIVLLPYSIVAMTHIITNFGHMRRLIHTLIVGGAAAGSMALMYVVLVFF